VFGLCHDKWLIAMRGKFLRERSDETLSKQGVLGCPYDHQIIMLGLFEKALQEIFGYGIFGLKERGRRIDPGHGLGKKGVYVLGWFTWLGTLKTTTCPPSCSTMAEAVSSAKAELGPPAKGRRTFIYP
jgi:hypothetical protein